MKKTQDLIINGIEGKFILKAMPLSQGLLLCRKIENMILTALKATDSIKEPIIDLIFGGADVDNMSDGEFIGTLRKANIENVMKVFSEVLNTMSPTEFVKFTKDMTQSCQFIGDGVGAIDFTSSPDKLEEIFAGNIASIYILLFKIMEYNNFTPFAFASIGERIKTMFISNEPAQTEESSENS